MSKTFCINIRVNRQQKEIIENNAKANGHNSTSEYVRTRSLCFNLFEEKINDIHRKLNLGENTQARFRKTERSLLEFI